MISVVNLSKTYKAKKGTTVKALKNISVDFGEKGMTFLVGKSGSGKSTLLNLLGGIDSPTSGEIIFLGRKGSQFKEEDYDSYRNNNVGFIFQEYNLIENYNAGENVALALEINGKKPGRAEVEKALRQVDLTDENGGTLYERKVNELSGGQKQRAAIARALIKDPKIILADEPTGALDSENGKLLYELLKKLSEDRLVVVVSHDIDSAKIYADRIIELKDGEIINDSASGINDSFSRLSKETEAGQSPPESTAAVKKGHLAKTRCLKMGVSALTHKKTRLVLSIALSFIAFVIFGFSLTAGMVDENVVRLKTLYDNDIYVTIIGGDNWYDKGGAYESRSDELKERQLEEIKKYNNGVDAARVVSTGAVLVDQGDTEKSVLPIDLGMSGANQGNLYVMVGSASASLGIELNPATGESDANLRPDSRFKDKTLCRLPRTFDEIAVSDLTFNMFLKFGYRSESGEILTITSPDDLIGKNLCGLKVCGVYSTELNVSALQALDKPDSSVGSDNYEKLLGYGYSNALMKYSYVKEGFGENLHLALGSPYNGDIMLKLSGDLKKDKQLIKRCTYKEGKFDCSISISSPFSVMIDDALAFKEYLLWPAIIVSIVFTVFSILLIMNYLLTSLEFKKRELGILRALGARKKDVMFICLAESLIIACINLVLSLIGVDIVCAIMNGVYYVSLFNFGIIPSAAMALLCLAASAIATVFPVSRLMKKKPVEIINGK